MKAILLSLSLFTVAANAQVSSPPLYVAHEWGTFTSVQGTDGVQMFWNPLHAVDLPKFVYNWMGSADLGFLAKTAYVCRQRMETPVIYFYSKEPVDVDVSVDFPDGKITEWYPQSATPARLKAIASEKKLERTPSLVWEKMHVVPQTDAAHAAALIDDKTNSHYYAARETDSALVKTVSKKGTPEVEKFLFYRGTGNFDAPITVKLEGTDHRTVSVENHTAEELTDLYLFQNDSTHHGWLKIAHLSPNEKRSVSLDELTPVISVSELTSVLSGEFRAALVQQGLYEKEASAMVKTWEQSWFGESGLRILYPVTRHFTDQVLPIRITPAPAELVRVMVGRAEIITPDTEKLLEDAVDRYVKAGDDKAVRAQIAEEVHKYGFGRFDEAILRRVLTEPNHGKEFNSLSWELLQQATELDRAAAKSEAGKS